VWSARRPPPSVSFPERLVYTGLTRATHLLLLVLSDDLCPEHREVLGRLDSRRLIFWSEAAEHAFHRLKTAPNDAGGEASGGA
jgi:hypothetical protein